MGKFRGYDDGIGRTDRKIAELSKQLDAERAALRIRSSTVEVGGEVLFVREGLLYFRADDGTERPVIPTVRQAPFPNNSFEAVNDNGTPTNWAVTGQVGAEQTTDDVIRVLPGKRSLRLTTSSTPAIFQSLAHSEEWTVSPGATLEVVLDARGDGVLPTLGISIGSAPADTNPNPFFYPAAVFNSAASVRVNPRFEQLTFSITIPATHTRVRLFVFATSSNDGSIATVWVDNIGVTGGDNPTIDMSDYLRPGIQGAHVGDSITDRNGPYGYGERGGYPNTSPYWPQLAWFQHAAIAAGQRVYVPPTQNFAVGGKRTDEMLAEQVPLVLALRPLPAFVTVLGGTNDIGQGKTAAQVIASLSDIYARLNTAGIRVIAGTIPPSTVWDATKLARVCEVNRWIKAQATARSGVYVVDFFTPLADTAGAPRSGVLADGTHQTGKGAAIMGAALAPVLTTLFPPFDPFPGPGDTTQIAANPFQTGTAGPLGAGVTGAVATGWYVASADGAAVSVVASKVARTDSVPGEWTQLAITSGNVRFLSEVNITSGYAIGDQVQALVEFQTDANADTNTIQVEAYIVSAGSTNTAGTLTDTPGFDGTEVAWTRLPRSGVLRTPPMLVGTGTTGLALWVRIWGGSGGTFRIGRAAIVKL